MQLRVLSGPNSKLFRFGEFATSTVNSFPALDISEEYMRKFGATAFSNPNNSPSIPTLSNLGQYQFVLGSSFSTKWRKC